MPAVRIMRSGSEKVAFKSDPNHYYLRLCVQTHNGNNDINSFFASYTREMRINMMPKRNRDTGEIDQAHHDALINLFDSGRLFELPLTAMTVEIPITPVNMKYTSGANAGQLIMECGKPKVYKTIGISVFTDIIDGKEVPKISENMLRTMASRMFDYHVNAGHWVPANMETSSSIPFDTNFEEVPQQPVQQQPQPRMMNTAQQPQQQQVMPQFQQLRSNTRGLREFTLILPCFILN